MISRYQFEQRISIKRAASLMKIARRELDSNLFCICFFVFGLIPGFLAPFGVWCYRRLTGEELHEDFWLAVISTYSVTAGVTGLMFLWLGGIKVISKEEEAWKQMELDRAQKDRQDLKSFHAVHEDPVFGVPLSENGLPALEIMAGSRGEGSYYRVKPSECQLPPNFVSMVFYHADGFRERQRELWQRIMKDFDSLWLALWSQVNPRYQQEMSTEMEMPKQVGLKSVKIGKDLPGKPVAYQLSVEYGQDEYAEVWCVESHVTRVEFWM